MPGSDFKPLSKFIRAVADLLRGPYMLGEFPKLLNFDDKQLLNLYKVDFGRRLIAKFVFDPVKLWSNPNFTPVSNVALHPTLGEYPLLDMTSQIKTSLV